LVSSKYISGGLVPDGVAHARAPAGPAAAHDLGAFALARIEKFAEASLCVLDRPWFSLHLI